MTKLFKNGKSVLSVVVAFAVLAVSLFTGVVITSEASTCDDTLNVVYVDSADINLPSGIEAFMTENAGTEDDPIVISTVGELRYLVQKSTYATTHGKFFEIDENIDILVLQYEDYLGDLDEFMAKDATAVMEYLVANETANEKSRTQWQSGSSNANDCFAGTLDGNGVQIVGCYTGNGGIFSTVNEGAVLKNIEVSNGYSFAGWYASALVGAVYQSNTYLATKPTNDTCYGRVDFENIILHDNYIKNGGNAQQSTGILLGNVIGSSYEGAYYNHVGVTVDNCLTYDNKVLAETGNGTGTFVDHPYLFGILSTSYNGMNSYPNGSYTNSIFLDCAPYSYTNSNQAFRAIYYTNVYTTVATDHNPTIESWYTWDQFDITIAEADDFKGETVTTTCSNFDWNDWVVDDTDYPEPRAFHDGITLVDNGDGTHSETCACGFGGVAVEHIYTNGVCACGAEVTCATRKTIAWDGTVATGFASGTGTEDDPYIIATAAQLAYLVKDYTTQASLANSAGQYFKIDDSIGAIVLQPEAYASDIMALADAAAVKAYFEANAANMKKWVNEAWEQGAFCGTFDGNGATVYGLYQDTIYNAGLFTTVDAGCTIKNIAVKNSYMKSTTGSGGTYQVGGIAAVCAGNSYGAKNMGVLWFDNCIVANNYMTHDTAQASRCGTIIGSANAEAVYVTNCLVYGNDAKHADIDFPLVGEMSNSATNASAIIPEGLTTTNRADNADFIANGIYDTIALGSAPYNTQLNLGNGRDSAEVYKNVYTDQAVGEVAFANGNRTYTEEQIKGIAEADLAGLAIGDAWIATDAIPELKAFHDAEFTATPDATDAYAGHSLACSCGLAGATEEHNYVVDDESLGLAAEYKCQDCGFVCDHMSADHNVIVETPRDCVNDYSLTVDCECGFHYEEIMDAAYGHSFIEHDAVAGDDCQTNGTIAYKECTRCDKNYAADAATDEPFENAITDLTGEKGEHVETTDANGTVYGFDDASHWTICSVCDEIIETTAHTGETEANGAEGHKVVCDVCNYESDNAPHGFGDDNICDTCNWVCPHESTTNVEVSPAECEQNQIVDKVCDLCGVTVEAGVEVDGTALEHVWVDGEVIEEGNCTTDRVIAQYCDVCGEEGPNRVETAPGHSESDWQEGYDSTPACVGDGSHEEIKICTECFEILDTRTVTDPHTGHDFDEIAAEDPTCIWEGCIAHKYCLNCGYHFAVDAADDEPYENALEYEDWVIDIDPDAHSWQEFEGGATCDEDGYTTPHRFCTECYLFEIEGSEEEILFDYDEFWECEYDEDTWEVTPIGIGAIADVEIVEAEREAWATFAKEKYDVDVPAYPAEDAEWEEFEAYWASYDEVADIDENWTDAWDEYWYPVYEQMWADATHQYFLEKAAAAGIELVEEATGHTLVKVDEVAATYDKTGTKAHYKCECGKLYSDAEGKNEVTADSLVIAKLVKEEKPAGDESDKSPATGESVASVAAVAALIGAAFVLVRKSKKA